MTSVVPVVPVPFSYAGSLSNITNLGVVWQTLTTSIYEEDPTMAVPLIELVDGGLAEVHECGCQLGLVLFRRRCFGR